MKLVLRKPARCLDCVHAVGPQGDHYLPLNSRLVRCKACPRLPFLVHHLSMAWKYEAHWTDEWRTEYDERHPTRSALLKR